MSCGQIALRQAGIKVKQYFASEIDKHAIAQTQHNFPDTVQLGSVTGVRAADLPHIDLLIGGSPCQGFSFAGKQLNFDDPRSVLFFEYVRILREIQEYNPGVKFLLENVRMRRECENVISEQLGLFPIVINSALVSAQNRVYSAEGISPALCSAHAGQAPAILTADEVLRCFTPTECARLQTIPEWYEWKCSKTQIYQMLGNGWTVDVITHIFNFLKNSL